MTLDPRLQSPDIVTLRVPLALRTRDVSDLSLVRDELLITATETGPAHRSLVLTSTPSGTWTASRVPGLSPEESVHPSHWPAVARPFELRVRDPRNRYLTSRLVASLPAEAPIAWPNFDALPPDISPALLPAGSPPGSRPDFVPLFPAVAGVAPGARAQVLAHLAIVRGGEPAGPASFAVMTVSIGGQVKGVGVADGQGAILVSFPYPLLPAPTPAERAAGTTRFEWNVGLAVYCGQLPTRADGAPPLLTDILAQLNRAPSRVLERLESPDPLPELTLRVGQALVARSARAAPAQPSSLFILPA